MKNQKGLTLVELLIATTLMTLIIMAVFKVFAANARLLTNNVGRSKFQTDARLIIKSLIGDFESATGVIEPAFGDSANKLVLITASGKTITYELVSGVLKRINGTQEIELSKHLVSTEPLFSRMTSRNSIDLLLVFNETSMKPANDFRIQTVLNLKNKANLTLANDSLTTKNLNAVYFINSTSGWAVGNDGIILKYDGTNPKPWSSTSQTTQRLNSIYMLSSKLGYTVGEKNASLSFDGNNWNDTAWNLGDLKTIFAEDKNNITVAGSDVSGDFINIFNGVWSRASQTVQINSVSQIQDTRWAVGNNGNVLKWVEASGWMSINDAAIPNQNLNSISIVLNGTTDYYLWVVGDTGTILKYDSLNGVWSNNLSNSNYGKLNSVSFFNKNNGYIVGEAGMILRYNNGSFKQLQSLAGSKNLNAVHLFGNDRGWIVGDGGTRIRIGEL